MSISGSSTGAKTRNQSSRQSDAGLDPHSQKKSTDEKLEEIHSMLSMMVTKDFMEAKIQGLKRAIKQENKDMIGRLEGGIYDLENEKDYLKERVRFLEEQLDTMVTRNSELESKQNFVSETVKILVESRDIDIAHRLWRYGINRPRPIIVKFTHRMKKAAILRARLNLKGTGTAIFEDLTRANQGKLSEAYKLNCVQNTYSLYGKLFAVFKTGRNEDFHITPHSRRSMC